MRDEMNFGVLPNHEMEKFLLLEPDGHSLLVFHPFTNSTILNHSNFILESFCGLTNIRYNIMRIENALMYC